MTAVPMKFKRKTDINNISFRIGAIILLYYNIYVPNIISNN